MYGNAVRPAQPDVPLAQPPTDSISKLLFSPVASPFDSESSLLAVGSWDNNVRIYGVKKDGTSTPMFMYSHDKPVLDLAWHSVSLLLSGDRVCTEGLGRNQALLGWM
jgi:mRNA export factor